MRLTRREFGAAFWAAVAHAQQTGKLSVLDAATARDVEAISAQILPSTDGPGAREAGVLYFIDRALATFDSDKRDDYRKGMAQFQAARERMFPQSASIAALTGAQQVELLRSVEQSDFFELIRTHTLYGFLGNPSYGGNRDRAGWKHIGFEHRMAWSHPFGYYDREEAQ